MRYQITLYKTASPLDSAKCSEDKCYTWEFVVDVINEAFKKIKKDIKDSFARLFVPLGPKKKKRVVRMQTG